MRASQGKQLAAGRAAAKLVRRAEVATLGTGTHTPTPFPLTPHTYHLQTHTQTHTDIFNLTRDMSSYG